MAKNIKALKIEVAKENFINRNLGAIALGSMMLALLGLEGLAFQYFAIDRLQTQIEESKLPKRGAAAVTAERSGDNVVLSIFLEGEQRRWINLTPEMRKMLIERLYALGRKK